jgi:hypothetical protein
MQLHMIPQRNKNYEHYLYAYSIHYHIHVYNKYKTIHIKGLTITHQRSVWRSIQYTANNDNDRDHYESYESSKHYSPFWLHCDKITRIRHKQDYSKGTQHLRKKLHVSFILVDSYATSNVITKFHIWYCRLFIIFLYFQLLMQHNTGSYTEADQHDYHETFIPFIHMFVVNQGN